MTVAGVVRCFGFAIFLVAGILTLSNIGVSAQCEGSIPGLISQCQQYVSKSGQKEPPSAGCCAVVKKVDIQCICRLVTKEVEQIVSMEKVVYVARTCGLTISKGMKCGSMWPISSSFSFPALYFLYFDWIHFIFIFFSIQIYKKRLYYLCYGS